MNHDDAQAIAEVLRGNAEAYEPLVLKYQDRLFNSLLQVARSREEAEDVAQEAFVQAYVKLDTFQQHSTFYTWLYRIAFNLALSRRRRKRLEVSVEQTREVAGIEPTDPGEAPEEQLHRSERQAQVHAALGRMSGGISLRNDLRNARSTGGNGSQPFASGQSAVAGRVDGDSGGVPAPSAGSGVELKPN